MSPAPAIRFDGASVDLSSRAHHSTTIVASPTDNTETIICSLTIGAEVAVQKAIYVVGWAAYTVGTSGTGVTLKIRQTNAAGTTKGSTGIVKRTAADLAEDSVFGVDTAATLPGQVYVLTMLVTAGAAASTVSACELLALVI